AEHAAGVGERRVEPEGVRGRPGASTLGCREAHLEVAGPALKQLPARRVWLPRQRVRHHLDESGGEGVDGIEDGARAVEEGAAAAGLSDGRTDGPEQRRHGKHQSDGPTVRRSDRHAPTDAGSATRRPMTSAIARTSRISWANWSGNSVWAPAESAAAGLGWTSIMMTSA